MQFIDNISVCVDCLMYIANGVIEEDFDNRVESIEEEYKKLKGKGQEVFLDYSEDHADGFSWYPCGHCGSSLGGDRFKANIYQL
jgi:hypothetical protein